MATASRPSSVLKARKAAQASVPPTPGPEDRDSEISEVSFPLAKWRFDDDDDAASAPPVV